MRHKFALLLILLAALPAAHAAPVPLRLHFDYAAAEDFLRAARREPLTAEQLRDFAGRRGASAMVRNTVKYIPDTPADGYAAALGELARTGHVQVDAYGLNDSVAQADTVATLLTSLQRDAPAMAARIAGRLASHWPEGEAPVDITVHLVVGGASDGFVLDGETAPEFFVAIDKAGGDIAGLEQNVTHESVHVLQRQLALRHCPQRTAMDQLPPLQRFHATMYEEGVANYLADPADIRGEGDYIAMWRGRYQRNASPERVRENLWLYDSLRDGLRNGALGWDTAYQFGFFGDLDSRMYFVGRDIARRLDLAGAAPLSTAFVCMPEAFFSHPASGMQA